MELEVAFEQRAVSRKFIAHEFILLIYPRFGVSEEGQEVFSRHGQDGPAGEALVWVRHVRGR